MNFKTFWHVNMLEQTIVFHLGNYQNSSLGATIFHQKKPLCKKIREREGNEELDKLCLGEIVQEQKPPPRWKEDSVYWLLEQQNYEDVATGSGVCETQPP